MGYLHSLLPWAVTRLLAQGRPRHGRRRGGHASRLHAAGEAGPAALRLQRAVASEDGRGVCTCVRRDRGGSESRGPGIPGEAASHGRCPAAGDHGCPTSLRSHYADGLTIRGVPSTLRTSDARGPLPPRAIMIRASTLSIRLFKCISMDHACAMSVNECVR